MFPTFVWKVQLQSAVRDAIDSSAFPVITRLRMGSPPLAAGRGWQSVVVRVQDGTLLLFPSYLKHSVDSNSSGEERISISFNIMFSQLTEALTRPLWSPDR